MAPLKSLTCGENVIWTKPNIILLLISYLAQADGSPEGLGPGKEVDGFLDLVLVLVLPGQVVARGPVARLVAHLGRLPNTTQVSFTTQHQQQVAMNE